MTFGGIAFTGRIWGIFLLRFLNTVFNKRRMAGHPPYVVGKYRYELDNNNRFWFFRSEGDYLILVLLSGFSSFWSNFTCFYLFDMFLTCFGPVLPVWPVFWTISRLMLVAQDWFLAVSSVLDLSFGGLLLVCFWPVFTCLAFFLPVLDMFYLSDLFLGHF